MNATKKVNPEPTDTSEPDGHCIHAVSLKELARDYVIVGIKGKLLRVRRKRDGSELWIKVSIDE